MSFLLKIDLGKEECPRCKAVYAVSARDFSERAVGHFTCQCGHEMNRWRAHRTYSYELVSQSVKMRA